MNAPHLHLLVNHVALFAVSFGLLGLLYAWFKRSREFCSFALLLFMLAGVFSWIALETGESAEDAVEQLSWFSETTLEPHEEAAEVANVATIALAGVSLLLLIVSKFRANLFPPLCVVLVLLALVALALLARTANLGGQIRHEEIRDTAVLNE